MTNIFMENYKSPKYKCDSFKNSKRINNLMSTVY